MESDSEDIGHSGSPGISRRTLIRAAGTLGVATGAAGGVAAATAFRAPAARAQSGGEFLGSNLDVFQAIQSVVPGLSGIRMYGEYPTQNSDGSWTNNVRSTWPQPIPSGSTTPIANTGPLVYSIYPIISDVLDGTLDSTLMSLIGSAPAGAYLNCWHEALSLASDNQYPDITVQYLYLLHEYMNALVHASNAVQGSSVTYGSIFGGNGSDLSTLFESVPPNLGFYGQDMYTQGTGSTSSGSGIDVGMEHLEDFITGAKAVATNTTTPGYPSLMIPECNYAPDASLDDDPALRGQWFEAIATRMHTYGANAIGTLTFWNPSGSLSGPWDPTAAWYPSTVADMNDIINNIYD
jgi:hypothetical protein